MVTIRTMVIPSKRLLWVLQTICGTNGIIRGDAMRIVPASV